MFWLLEMATKLFKPAHPRKCLAWPAYIFSSLTFYERQGPATPASVRGRYLLKYASDLSVVIMAGLRSTLTPFAPVEMNYNPSGYEFLQAPKGIYVEIL